MFPETLSLDAMSVLLVWTAILIYALAFVAYGLDIAFRSSPHPVAARATVREPALVGVAAGSATTDAPGLDETGDAASASSNAHNGARPMWARIGTSLTWLAFLFHLGATVLRGIAAERVPWSNMYEFALTGTLLITAVYLAVLIRYDLRYLGTFMVGLVVVLLGGSTLGYYVEVVPLMDPLKSVWLVIHVFVASLATAFFALAFAISVLQLLQARRETARPRPAKTDKKPRTLRILLMIPGAETLETLAYRFVVIGFAFWTFTLIAGAIWAQESWGRYWGFDTKEVWTFIIWVVYAGYLHARATRGWRGTRSAWLAIVGFLTVVFNFSIVNVFFKGLHAYSGLS